jgi:predicted membrane metal-binding protein
MAGNFHESYGAAAVKLPSDRSTGLVFAGVALIVAYFWRDSETVLWAALAASIVLAIVSLAVPILLRPLNIVWFKFGQLLHHIVNPLVMFVIFAFIFLPAGLVMRMLHDPLRRRRNADGSTYWVDRKKENVAASSMSNQF